MQPNLIVSLFCSLNLCYVYYIDCTLTPVWNEYLFSKSNIICNWNGQCRYMLLIRRLWNTESLLFYAWKVWNYFPNKVKCNKSNKNNMCLKNRFVLLRIWTRKLMLVKGRQVNKPKVSYVENTTRLISEEEPRILAS